MLQEFNITILDRLGKENIVVDFLSRMQNGNNDTLIVDSFYDKYLLTVSTKTPWFADIANYLAIGKSPPQLSTKERHKFIKGSAPYSWIEGKFYQTIPDLIIQRSVQEDVVPEILEACHDEPCGEHISDRRCNSPGFIFHVNKLN